MEEILASVQVRRDTKANWETINPILLEGEAAYELDTDMFKIGDGIKHYSDLPYHNKVGPQGPQGEPGPTPQISMNVSTGNPGTSASVSVTGTAENPVINLTVPRGDTGKTGSTGPKGDTGNSGVYIGTSQPTDSNINVWIDSDGEPTEVIDDFAREAIGQLKDDLGEIIYKEIGVNLLNTNAIGVEHGKALQSDGSVTSAQEDSNVSDFISVNSNDGMLRSTSDLNAYCVGYTSEKEFDRAYGNLTKQTPLTLSETTKYVRVQFYNAMIPIMLYQSDSILGYEDYIEYTDIKIEKVLPIVEQVFETKIDKIGYSSKNLFNKADVVLNKYTYIDNYGYGYSEDCFVSSLIPVEPNTQYFLSMTGISTWGYGIQYFSDKSEQTFISGANIASYTDTKPFTTPENAKYVRFCGKIANINYIQLEKGRVRTGYRDYGELDNSDIKKNIYVYTSDTQEEIYLKLYDAYMRENRDIHFEHGVYLFDTIFELIKTKYGRGTAYELPIGGNCRYFFNGSTLIATQTSTDSNVISNESLMGSWRESGSYELHDGTLKANGMVYVIHDEASGSMIPYTRKYHNIRMEYTSNENRSGMCLGGGTGCKGNVEFDGCVFITNSDSSMDGGYHGKVANIDVDSVFYATVKNCYFSKRFQTGGLTANETAELIYCGNSHSMSPGGDKWNIIEWNNTTRQ